MSDPPYIARDPGPNPNISTTPPWRLFAILGGGFIAVMFVLWLVLGALGGFLARQLPDSIERRLGSVFDVSTMQSDDSRMLALQQHLQGLVDRMAAELPPRDLQYRVVVIDDPAINAVAVPGGWILVFRGLADAVQSENELAMVLGHELAHHVHRDHLERMGRRLVVGAAFSAILGNTSGLEQFGSLGIEGLELEMGRDDEREADALGLELLESLYGHVAGSTDFFARLVDQDAPRSLSWVSTHPLSRDRVERIEKLAEERGYRFDRVRPLPDFEDVR